MNLRRTVIFDILRSTRNYYKKTNKDRIKNVLVTGVAHGLGRWLVIDYARNGFRVIGIDIVPEEQLDESVKKAIVGYVEYDLRNIEGIEGMLSGIIEKHQRIDLLINNAAIMDFRMLTDYQISEIRDIVSVNFTSVAVLIKGIMPYMIQQNFGRIINVSSRSAFRAEDKFALYSPTKAGMMLLSDSVGRYIDNKLNHDITINSVNPDRINTPEYLEKNPGIDQSRIISTSKIYRKIQRIVNSEVNGETFPILGFWVRVSLQLQYFKRLFLH